MNSASKAEGLGVPARAASGTSLARGSMRAHLFADGSAEAPILASLAKTSCTDAAGLASIGLTGMPGVSLQTIDNTVEGSFHLDASMINSPSRIEVKEEECTTREEKRRK